MPASDPFTREANVADELERLLDYSEHSYAPIALLKQAIPLSRAFLDIAERARVLCNQLFDNPPTPEEPSWRINYNTRALSPSAIDTPDASQSLLTGFLSQLDFLGRLATMGCRSELLHGRLRYQPVDQINHPLHQDRMFIDCAQFLTLWVPLVEPGLVTNRDTPGLRLFKYPVNRLLKQRPGVVPEVDASDLETFCRPEQQADSFYYPELQLGDVLLFRELVPHASYIPQGAHLARVSCDFRIPLGA